jgi:hypothetical protein
MHNEIKMRKYRILWVMALSMLPFGHCLAQSETPPPGTDKTTDKSPALSQPTVSENEERPSVKPMSLELHLDLRSRLALQGQSRSSLYSSALQFRSNLAPGLQFYYIGAQNNAPTLNAGRGRQDRFITQQATLEKDWGTQQLQIGVVRLPFGLYDSQEFYAAGLIDYPLMRVDYAEDAVNWGVPGVKWKGGSAQLQGEFAVFGGQAAGVWGNLNNVSGTALRVQTYTRDLIFGLSRWDGSQSASRREPGPLATHLTGFDMRFTRPHLMIRGEYMFGKLGGKSTTGWYLDFHYHLPKYERATLVTRLEEFQFGQGLRNRQITLGVRYTLGHNWVLAVNWRRNNRSDIRSSWTPATGRSGDLYFQLFQKVRF